MDTTKDFLHTLECLELHYMFYIYIYIYWIYASLKNYADHSFALYYYITNNEMPGK